MNRFKNYRYILFGLALILFSCKSGDSETPEEEHHDEEALVVELSEAQMKNAGIAVGKIEEKQISGTIKVNGKLDVPPQQLVSVSAPLGGFLKSTELLEGTSVRKGQIIAIIENIDFIQIQQDFVEAKGNVEFLKADYERQQELAKQNVNSQKTLQQAKANYLNWNAKYNGLLEKLRVLNLNPSSIEQGNMTSSISLHSPINGYVTEVNVNIGKFVSATDVLFEIVDTEHLHAELIVFEKDVPKLKIGQKVRFTLANESNERMATIYLIGREISENRTVQIHCHIDKEDKEFLPGMYLSAAVETGGALVSSLPNEAVIDFQGKKNLFVVTEKTHDKAGHSTEGKEGHSKKEEGTHFEMIEVQIGSSELGYTEVILPEDFNKDVQVVVKGAYSLLSKLKNSEEEGSHTH